MSATRSGIHLAGFVVFASCCGCLPIHPTVRQPHNGQVIDGVSRRPIANAVVRVESYRVLTPPVPGGLGWMVRSLEVTTDAAGGWSVPREREWMLGIFVPDALPLFVDVYCVFAEGYPPEIRNAYKDWLGVSREDETATRDQNEMPSELLLFRSSSPAPSVAEPKPTRPLSRCGVPER